MEETTTTRKRINDYIARTPEEKQFMERFLEVLLDKYETLHGAGTQLGIGSSQINTWKNKGYMPSSKLIARVIRKHNINANWLFYNVGRRYLTSSPGTPDLSELMKSVNNVKKAVDDMGELVSKMSENKEGNNILKEFAEFLKWRQS